MNKEKEKELLDGCESSSTQFLMSSKDALKGNFHPFSLCSLLLFCMQ